MQGRAIIAFAILLASCPSASALNPSLDVSQYGHMAWKVRDGVLKAAPHSIAQTPDGYLWLATDFGLLRFDGVRATPWSPPGDRLPSDEITELLTTRDGRLWIGTRDGLASWKDGTLAHYPQLDGQAVHAFLEDHEGILWVGTYATAGGTLSTIQNGLVHPYGVSRQFGRGVYSLYEDKHGSLWVALADGLWRWKPGLPKFYPLSDLPTARQTFAEDDQDGILLVTHGVRRFVDGKAMRAYPLPHSERLSRARRVYRDRNGGFWIGTSAQGLVHEYQGRTDVFSELDGLSGDYIENFFEDREGNLWVMTRDGLDRFRDVAVPTISLTQGLSANDVWSVLAARDGSVWIANPQGLDRWTNGKITSYTKANGLPVAPQGLFEDNRGRIWVNARYETAYFDNGRFYAVRSIPLGSKHGVAEDRSRDFWFPQDDGFTRWREGSAAEKFPWPESGHKDGPLSLTYDPVRDGFWIGFHQSGLAYLKDGKVRESYTAADGLGEGPVNRLALDREGVLWAATGGGLSRVKDGRVATLTSKNGLPCDVVHWAIEDDDRSFWLFTPCGLVRVARSELDAWAADPKRVVRSTVLDSADGVRTRAFRGGYMSPVGKSPDGKLWFWTEDGVSVIDPVHLPFNQLPPPVHVERIIADRNTYELAAKENLRFSPHTRDLEVEYTALSFAAPEKIRFRYKLEGRDADWQDVGNRRQAFYNDLPPRNYRFRVIAANNNGVWNEAGAFVDFSVAPAYYQTTWFQASCAIAVFALFWGLYRYRLDQVAREFNVRLEERVGERTRLARDLHDTLLQSFHGLMLRFQVVSELLPEGEAKERLERTLERADIAIAEGRNAVHDLRLSATETNDLAEALNAAGKELSEGNAADFNLTIEGQTRELHPIIRDEIYRISREVLSNAFRHAHARHIEAEMSYAPRAFRLRIRDDGEGIPAEVLEQGRTGHFGLPGIRERAKQIGAELTIWSRPGSGTEMDLSLAATKAYDTPPRQSRFWGFGRTGDD